ncbi:Uncharacterised protein [Nocardia brasiliensis]|nr:Uncharacterised protein [Nocardia brasiliensis]
MDIDSELFALDRGLAAFAARHPETDDWMTQANRDSARGLRDMVHEAWMPRRRGVIARFHDGAVAGHTGPAYQILRAAYEFNDAVVAVANLMLDRPYSTITDSVRKRFGLLMRPLLAGSVEIDLVCPLPGIDEAMQLPGESPGQAVMPELERLESHTGEALNRVLSVLRQSANGPSTVSEHTDQIGADGWRKLARLAGRCVDADFTIDFSSRTEPAERFSFAPPHATQLKTFIKERSLTATEVTYYGLWQTASSVRTWFDLQTPTGQRISGTLPTNLVDASMKALDQQVRAIVREEADPDKDQVTKRTLVSLELTGPGRHRGLPPR